MCGNPYSGLRLAGCNCTEVSPRAGRVGAEDPSTTTYFPHPRDTVANTMKTPVFFAITLAQVTQAHIRMQTARQLESQIHQVM